MKFAAINALAACLAVAAGPVSAAAYGSATFGNVSVTLIDLDPNDGVAASISFLPNPIKYAGGAEISGTAQSGLAGGQEPGNIFDFFDRAAAWQQTNVSGMAQTALATSTVSVTGSNSGLGFTGASLSGSALSGATQGAFFAGQAILPGNWAREFTLSANTKVVFSLDAAFDVRTTIGRGADGLSGESASASMELYAAGYAPDGFNLLEDQRREGVSVRWDDSAPNGGADSWSGAMSVSFSNLGDTSADGKFWAHAQLDGTSVSAVPEPSTYAMLLGGLGLLGLLRRRRAARV